MLVIFKSKVAGDIIMFEENARPIIELLGKEVRQGIITAAETADAIVKLEAEIARMKVVEAEEKAQREAQAMEREKESQDGKGELKAVPPAPISFVARTYPLLDMLKRANEKGRDIVWGV